MTQAMTAVYETRAAAEAARNGLLALRIPVENILIRGAGNSEPAPGSGTGSGEHGFWRNLFESFIPKSEHPTYLEGMRRGAMMVGVQVPNGLEDQAEHVLESCGPIDLNAHASSWRESGWNKGSPDPAAGVRLRVRRYRSTGH
jgi:hypothetical protein